MTTIRKAVFPAAGLGTRFLPATKAQPKEMLVLVDKPIIQYGVEEAVASGVAQHHPRHRPRARTPSRTTSTCPSSWKPSSRRAARRSCSHEIRKISNLINFAYVRQGEPLGLGHAVLVTRELVGNEPFAVILGDDVIDADPPALRQMVRRVRASERPGARGRARAGGPGVGLRRRGHRGVARRRRLPDHATSSRSRGARRRRRTSRSSGATSSRPTSSTPCRPPAPIGPARSSSPTACAAC